MFTGIEDRFARTDLVTVCRGRFRRPERSFGIEHSRFTLRRGVGYRTVGTQADPGATNPETGLGSGKAHLVVAVGMLVDSNAHQAHGTRQIENRQRVILIRNHGNIRLLGQEYLRGFRIARRISLRIGMGSVIGRLVRCVSGIHHQVHQQGADRPAFDIRGIPTLCGLNGCGLLGIGNHVNIIFRSSCIGDDIGECDRLHCTVVGGGNRRDVTRILDPAGGLVYEQDQQILDIAGPGGRRKGR